jgi:hypothetical protein
MSKSDITDCIESLEDIYNKVDAMYPKDERKMYEEMIEYLAKNIPSTDVQYNKVRVHIIRSLPNNTH